MHIALVRGAIIAFVFATLASFLRAQSPGVELANLREDVHLLSQKVEDMRLRMEQLEAENRELRSKSSTAAQSYATVAQLNEAVAELNRSIKSTASSTKNETLQQVSSQLEKLAKQTDANFQKLAAAVNSSSTRAASNSPVSAPTFSDDYSKTGITYTVVKGDSIGTISKKTGGSPKDIINANKLADPSKIQAGQTLFIPGGK